MTITADDATIYFRHSLYYNMGTAVPAEEVAEALLGLSRIVERSPRVLKLLAPDISMPKARLYVEKLESGSLAEDIVVAIGFGTKKKMDRTLRAFGKKYGFDLSTRAGVIRAILVALILAGGIYAYNRYTATAPAPATHIEIKENTIIVAGAKELGMTAEELVKLVDSAVSRKDRLASDAVAVVRPAKRDPKASIQFDGDEKLKIPASTIAAIPNEVRPDKTEETKVHPNVEVHLRALDLDNALSGWAAVVPAITPRRIRLELDDTINPDELYGRKVITASIEAVYRVNVHGQKELRAYRLVDVLPDAGPLAPPSMLTATSATPILTAPPADLSPAKLAAPQPAKPSQ